MTGPSVAIAGAGPAGFYVADALLRRLPDARIDLVDRLPTPYGLVRGGVAPDHQGTKNIVRQFERTLTRSGVRFVGNVAVGRDVSYEEIRQAYDVVVIATGAPVDRRLGIPGEDLSGVYGSGAFVGWYNGVPDYSELAPPLDHPALAVIGNGNVALDIVRILAKTPEELAASDLPRHARETLSRSALRDIFLIGRRGPAQAVFSPSELAELGDLAQAHPVVDASQVGTAIPERGDAGGPTNSEKILDLLHRFAESPPRPKPVRIHLLFHATPAAILGNAQVTGLHLERNRSVGDRVQPAGGSFDLQVGVVVTAIGYRSAPIRGLPFDDARGIVKNVAGRVTDGVYAAGWCRRGAQGTVPDNRSDAMSVAGLIVADLGADGGTYRKPGAAMLDALLAARGVERVDHAGWQRIHAAESARAGPGRPREKLTQIQELLAAARG
jgi:ferredoxin--NADP+ reductase